MSENTNKIVSLKHMIAAHQKSDAKIEALKERVEDLVTAGGEPNVITAINVNGAPVPIAGKAVDITVPTKASELDNDAKYQTDTDVAAAVAAADHLKRKIVDSVYDIDPEADDATQYIYMVLKSSTKAGDKYDEYMVIDGAVERVGDWTVDLSGYVPVEEGKGLSSNDFTDEDKAKLAGIEFATDEEVAAALAEIYGTDGE